MNDLELRPLKPGDLALRFRVEFRSATTLPRVARPMVTGLEVIEVIAQTGDLVLWTNHKPARAHAPAPVKFSHTSHRRELIALDWLNTLCARPAENPPVPNTGLPA